MPGSDSKIFTSGIVVASTFVADEELDGSSDEGGLVTNNFPCPDDGEVDSVMASEFNDGDVDVSATIDASEEP